MYEFISSALRKCPVSTSEKTKSVHKQAHYSRGSNTSARAWKFVTQVPQPLLMEVVKACYQRCSNTHPLQNALTSKLPSHKQRHSHEG